MVSAFLADYPPHIRELAERARALVLGAVPNAIERVYSGWRLIGYRVPQGKASRYFAFLAPLEDEVRLGFELGVHMDDPRGLLQGDGTQVRYIALRSNADVSEELRPYITQAAAVACVPREALAPR